MDNEQAEELKKAIEEYVKVVGEEAWPPTPEHEGDVLYIAGIRDEIHSAYELLDEEPRRTLAPLLDSVRAADARWQSFVLRNIDPRFKMKRGNIGWWYNLDILEQLSEEERSVI